MRCAPSSARGATIVRHRRVFGQRVRRSPLTFDHDYLLNYIDMVDEQILQGKGQTAIGDGLALANYLVARQSNGTAGHQVIVLFTDSKTIAAAIRSNRSPIPGGRTSACTSSASPSSSSSHRSRTSARCCSQSFATAAAISTPIPPRI